MAQIHRTSATTIPRNAHPLVRLVFAGMIEQRISYVEMAELAGLSRESLTAWRVRYTPDFNNIRSALGVLGLNLQVVDASGRPYAPQIVLRNSRNGHRISVPPHAAPIVQLVFSAMAEQRITYEVLADRSGLSRESLVSWRVRHMPDLVSLEAVLGVMGLRFEVMDYAGKPYRPRPETLARQGQTAEDRMRNWAIYRERAAARPPRAIRRPRAAATHAAGNSSGPLGYFS
jgi:DNA-binding phage protein